MIAHEVLMLFLTVAFYFRLHLILFVRIKY